MEELSNSTTDQTKMSRVGKRGQEKRKVSFWLLRLRLGLSLGVDQFCSCVSDHTPARGKMMTGTVLFINLRLQTSCHLLLM